MGTLSLCSYISRLLYPRYPSIWFLIYMYFKYHSVAKRHAKYSVKILSDSVLWNIIRTYPKSSCDINNCVLVHPDHLYPSDKILSVVHSDNMTNRKAFVVPSILCEKNVLYISNTYLYNDFLACIDYDVKLLKSSKVQFAQEIELALIAGPYDINNTLIDSLVKSYFQLPKFIKKGDIVSINVKYVAAELFFTDPKLNVVNNIYFKCNKVLCDNRDVCDVFLCAVGESSIRQSANVQSFVPSVIKIGTREVQNEKISFSEVTLCPYGLETYLDKLTMCTYPFLTNKKLRLKPIFLIQGEDGCGDDVLVKTLAMSSGMHHFKVNNADLSANVYAQNETKLNNVFFNAKMCSPCIISIHKFENFGKNSEGQYDSRLISSFINYINDLFENNSHPIFLFCCSRSIDLPPELKRVFLEVFEIHAPTDMERTRILSWILEKNEIEIQSVDLNLIANKTHGFYFEDLKALVYYAENAFYRRGGKSGKESVTLTEEDFDKAIDFMHSNYNESLGAPKVPKVQWSDVGGLNEVKEEIIKTIDLPLKHPEIFKNSGLTRSGILLYGPPGTGKTLIAKAVATECSFCFLTVKGPELLNMYVGQSEQNVREVFERARQASPCIIFFDELDSLAPNRGLSGDSGGVMDRVVSQLLAEMDGLDGGGKVFIIGATNRPDLIDPALLRPGRFDKMLYVGPCTDVTSKISVLKALTRKFQLADDVDFEEVVRICPPKITGADFYGICSNAWSSAAKRLIEQLEKGELKQENLNPEDIIVNTHDFHAAMATVKPTISEDDLKYFENLKKELSST